MQNPDELLGNSYNFLYFIQGNYLTGNNNNI